MNSIIDAYREVLILISCFLVMMATGYQAGYDVGLTKDNTIIEMAANSSSSHVTIETCRSLGTIIRVSNASEFNGPITISDCVFKFENRKLPP